MTDADVLRRAALVLERRSAKPDKFLVQVLLKVLRNVADDVEREQHNEVRTGRCRSAVCYGVNWRTGGALHTRCHLEPGHRTTLHRGPDQAEHAPREVAWQVGDPRSYETDREDPAAWEVAPCPT